MGSGVVAFLAFLVLQDPVSLRQMELHDALKFSNERNAAAENEVAPFGEKTTANESRPLLKYTLVGMVMGGLVGAAVGQWTGPGCFSDMADGAIRGSGCDNDRDTAVGALIGTGFGGLVGFLIAFAE